MYGQMEREEISGISKQVETADYYKDQSTLWRSFARSNPSDANAWYQLYKSERAFLQTEDYQAWINNNQVVFRKLEQIINEASSHLPQDNFEVLIMKAANTNSIDKITFLEKAFSIDPSRVESHEGLLVHYVVTSQHNKAKLIASKMRGENYFSYANLMWNTNALRSTESQAIFVGFGDMDVIPKWVLQYSDGLREDVCVVSLWKIANEIDYRKAFFEKYGIPNKDFVNKTEEGNLIEELLDHILEYAGVSVYMSCGSDISSIRKRGKANNLFVNGLNLKYAKEAFNNTDELIYYFEEILSLDYLHYDYQNHRDDEAVRKQLHLAYLPGIQKMIQIMDERGRGDRASYYRLIAKTIVDQSGRNEDIRRWFSNL